MNPQDTALIRKAAWRIVPFTVVLFFFTYIDRVNVGYAALTMNRDIGMSASAYGVGAGIFFIGYFIFEVPSNLLLHRIGPRRWIARIMITWGILSGATAFVRTPLEFQALRFLLGAAEAGFFPGMILYLTWFPGAVRGRIIGAVLIAIPLSSVLGAPVSTRLLGVSLWGLKGWQTMLVLEALPSVVLGVVVFLLMTDRPANARWLTDDQKARLQELLGQHADLKPRAQAAGAGLKQPIVWLFALIYFGIVLGSYGLSFWSPQIIKGFGGLSNVQVGTLSVIPYAVALVAMLAWGRLSDHRAERVWHLCLAAALGAAGFALAGFSHQPAVSLIGLTLAAAGVCATLPVFWTLPTALPTETAAAAGIALINSIGNLGGYFGPALMGWCKDWSGGYALGLFVLAGGMVMASGLALLAGRFLLKDARTTIN